MQLAQLARQRQPNAGATLASSLGAFDLIKAIEDPIELITPDAGAIVLDVDATAGFVQRHTHGNTAAVGRELERVAEQIGEDDFDPVWITENQQLARRSDELERQAARFG